MSDSVTTVSHQSWFSRLFGSVIGVLIGGLLYLGMFVLLFWNEGRAVKTYQDLEEGRKQVAEAPIDRVDSSFEGKLVHMVGPATTNETLGDNFGVSANALKFKRVVEMFQWTETKSTHRRKRAGGGETTETTYSYHREWVNHLVNSRSFHSPGGHENPSEWPLPQEQKTAQEIQFGAFKLSPELVEQINAFEHLPVTEQHVIPGYQRTADGFFRGSNPESPVIGDVRVHYEIVRPQPVSVIAAQRLASFAPFTLSSGRSQEMLTVGEHTAESMYLDAERFNELLTWLIRGGGFLGMWVGLAMVAGPLAVLLDVLPFLGDIVRWGTGAMAFVIAVISAAVGIAVAWSVYHPLFGALILAGAVAIIFLVRMLFAGRARAAEVNQMFAPPPPPPPPMNA